jgi:hypothetical protein
MTDRPLGTSRNIFVFYDCKSWTAKYLNYTFKFWHYNTNITRWLSHRLRFTCSSMPFSPLLCCLSQRLRFQAFTPEKTLCVSELSFAAHKSCNGRSRKQAEARSGKDGLRDPLDWLLVRFQCTCWQRKPSNHEISNRSPCSRTVNQIIVPANQAVKSSEISQSNLIDWPHIRSRSIHFIWQLFHFVFPIFHSIWLFGTKTHME